MKYLYSGLLAALLVMTSCVTEPKPVPAAAVPAAPVAPVAVVAAPVPVPLIIKETISYADGIVDRVVTYEYAEGSFEYSAKVSRKPSLVDPVERVLRTFAGDRIAGQKTFDAAGLLVSESVYEYNAAGLLTRETIRDAKGITQSVSDYKYSAAGQKTSWVVLNAAGNVLAQTDYAYNATGSLKQIAMSKGAGIATGTAEYEYDAEKRLVGLTYYTPAKTVERRTVYAWKDGNIAEETVYRSENRLERRYKYTYGSNREILTRTLVDAGGANREITVSEYRILMRK